MKKNKDKVMRIVKMQDVKTVKVTLEVHDEVYGLLAEAGRLHVTGDQTACFSYAFNLALKELAERTK